MCVCIGLVQILHHPAAIADNDLIRGVCLTINSLAANNNDNKRRFLLAHTEEVLNAIIAVCYSKQESLALLQIIHNAKDQIKR